MNARIFDEIEKDYQNPKKKKKKKGLLELSHMKAKNTKKITVFSKDNYEVQKFLI